MESERDKLIERTVRAFTKQFGDQSASTLNKMFTPDKVRGFVPTGNLAVDWVIGRPGWPLGRISEISGPFSSGKSTILAHSIGAAQAVGMACVLVDTEHSYDSTWATRFNVVGKHLILTQPKHLEELFDQLKFMIQLIKDDQPEVPVFIAVDSVSAAPAAAELEMEDSTEGKQRGLHAKIISEGLRKLTNLIWNQNVALVLVSQSKDNPGMMYGALKSKIGGHAIEFHAALMVETRKMGTKKDKKGAVLSQKLKVRTEKNKFVPPYRERTFELSFATGISQKEIMVEFMVDPLGLIKSSGGWFEYQGQKFRREDLATMLGDDLLPEIYRALDITSDEPVVAKEELPPPPVQEATPSATPPIEIDQSKVIEVEASVEGSIASNLTVPMKDVK